MHAMKSDNHYGKPIEFPQDTTNKDKTHGKDFVMCNL